MENTEIKSLLEALLFTSTEPLTLDHFISVIPDTDKTTLAEILSEMREEWEARHAGVVLREIANGYQLFSNPRWYPQIQALFSKPLIVRLSRSSLETLAIIAYKQPITLPEVSEIRSCNAAGTLKTLLECNFVKVLGRKRVVGRPFLYGTTREFLIHFGLKDLSELPQLQEFEELIGEKISPEIFESSASEEMELEPAPVEESEVIDQA
ncbi:MAG TPA: SMC-Scp complex subunit ScpB [Acidobacteriota bacterium]|nr:SMC-Scp complex subunit ScpB [Acidobacteriota bacterium]